MAGEYKEVGTKLMNAKNQQVYPYTKVECVEGLGDILDSALVAPSDAATNSVPITDDKGNVDWVELQAGNVAVKVSTDVFTSNDLETVLTQISNEIQVLKEMMEQGIPGTPGDPGTGTVPAGFIPVLMSELPEVGKVGVVYRIPSENTSSRNEYDEYYWTGDKFEKIGVRDPGGDEWGSEDQDSGYVWEDD